MRDWIALYASVLDSDTWADLGSNDTRLAWVVTLILAAQQEPEGVFDSESKLDRLLGKEGITYPTGAVADMVRVGAIEVTEGAVIVKGWERWQKRYRGPSDEPERKRLREQVRYWKAKASDPGLLPPDDDLSKPVTNLRHPVIEERRVEEIRVGPPYPPTQDEHDALDRYYELTLLRPWGRPAGRWISEMVGGFGDEKVQEALSAEWAKDKDQRTFLGRVDARLSRATEKVRKERAAEPKAKADPDVEARQRAVLSEMIGSNGGPRDEGNAVQDHGAGRAGDPRRLRSVAPPEAAG